MVIDDYDGELIVEFGRRCQGQLDMRLVMHGESSVCFPCWGLGEKGPVRSSGGEDTTVQTSICSSACPFPRFIGWLKAVAADMAVCTLAWDAQGAEGTLRWSGPGESGRLRVTWADTERFEYEVGLNRVQMVRAFYVAFRQFVESDCYDPLDYECMNLGETATLMLTDSSLGDLADVLAVLGVLR